MPKRFPARPEKDFRISSVQWQLDSEAKHRVAGFAPMSAEVICRRYWQLIDFLQTGGLTVRKIVSSVEDIRQLRN